MLSTRTITTLSDNECEDNQDDLGIFKAQMRPLNRKKISQVFENQKKAGENIINGFIENPELLLTMAVGKTQSGKTGVMYACIQEYTHSKKLGYVPVKNVYIITGLSSNDWKNQTKSRMPQILQENIYHRPELNQFMDSIKTKKNVLVLIDEVQIACGNKQTIAKDFTKCGLLNKQFLMENDVKIVEFSATPNGTLQDSKLWESNSTIMKIDPGDGYTGCIDLLNKQRVRQCKDLCDSPDAIKNILEIQNTINQYKSPKYHFIRTPKGAFQENVKSNFDRVFGETVEYIYHDSINENELDEKYLKVPPTRHTFIFLKEMARCANTYKKQHIGIWYERCVKSFNDDIVIQGLLGRATGYDDNGESIIFTNIDSIVRYEQLWESDFSDEIEWNSNSTHYSEKKGRTRTKKTFNGELTNGGEGVRKEIDDVFQTESKIIYLDLIDVQDMEKFWIEIKKKENLYHARNQFKETNKDENGFYKASIAHKKRAYMLSDIQKITKNWTGSAGFDISRKDLSKYDTNVIQSRIYICYQDYSEESKMKPILYVRKLFKKQ